MIITAQSTACCVYSIHRWMNGQHCVGCAPGALWRHANWSRPSCAGSNMVELMSLSVIIVTFNSRHEIDDCLSSLYSDLGGQSAHVIIVDSNSADGTADHVALRWPQVHVIALSANWGFAAANNLGLQASTSEAVLLLNPDTSRSLACAKQCSRC